MKNLETIAEKIRTSFEAKSKVRDQTLRLSRELIRHCANAIRATHRGEFENATGLLATAKALASEMVDGVADYADLYHAGYTQDALKEFAELKRRGRNMPLFMTGNSPVSAIWNCRSGCPTAGISIINTLSPRTAATHLWNG